MRRYQVLACEFEILPNREGDVLSLPFPAQTITLDGEMLPVRVTTNTTLLGRPGFTAPDMRVARQVVKRMVERSRHLAFFRKIKVRVYWGPFWKTYFLHRIPIALMGPHYIHSGYSKSGRNPWGIGKDPMQWEGSRESLRSAFAAILGRR